MLQGAITGNKELLEKRKEIYKTLKGAMVDRKAEDDKVINILLNLQKTKEQPKVEKPVVAKKDPEFSDLSKIKVTI